MPKFTKSITVDDELEVDVAGAGFGRYTRAMSEKRGKMTDEELVAEAKRWDEAKSVGPGWVSAPEAIPRHAEFASDQAKLEQVIFELEGLLHCGKFNVVEDFMAGLPVEETSPVVLIGVLTITHPGKAQLPGRARFLERAEKALVDKLGKERATKLLEHRR